MNTLETLARTLYGEARGEGIEGIQAVANVIMNRANNPRWWGLSVKDVCLKPYQFSCWNPKTLNKPEDSNYRAMAAVTDDNAAYAMCLSIADQAIRGILEDITNNADHYHTGPKPVWAKEKPVATVGRHTFYRLEL